MLCILTLTAAFTACGLEEGYIPTPRILNEPIGVSAFTIAVQSGNELLRDQIWAALQVLTYDGAVANLARNWGIDEENIQIPPAPAAIQSLEDEVRPRTLIVGIDPDMAPLSYHDEGGNFAGFDIDLAEAVSHYFGWELIFFPIDRGAREIELASGNVDVLWGGISLTPDIADRLTVTAGYLQNNQKLVVMTDSRIRRPRHMPNRTLGVVTESAAAYVLGNTPDFHDTLGTLIYFESRAQSLDELTAGNLDAVLMDEVVATYLFGGN